MPSSAARPAPTPRAPLPSGLVGRTAAAAVLGISLTEFKRRERDGRYQAAGIDERGYRYYDRLALESVQRAHPVTRRRDLRAVPPAAPSPLPTRTFDRSYDPETATAVFDELAIDEDLVRIVKKLALHPEVVRAVHAEWIVLRRIGGGYHVSGPLAREMAALELDGFPCASGEELLAALRAMAGMRDPCGRCGKRPRRTPRLCSPCEEALREREREEIEASRPAPAVGAPTTSGFSPGKGAASPPSRFQRARPAAK